jgi:RNA polymerase sigma factor (sigma-70 family)
MFLPLAVTGGPHLGTDQGQGAGQTTGGEVWDVADVGSALPRDGAGEQTQADADATDILSLVAPLRRFVSSRMTSPHDAEDVVQETLARLLATRGRLDEGALTAYAFTVARNLIISQHREAEVRRRHAPRLVERREPTQPENALLASEDRRALAAALDELPKPHREWLLEHVMEERPLADIAASDGQPAPALAAQLGRARAKLRLDYLLALRNVDLPTPRCRPVLLALSAGDRRRQAALRAGAHLLRCPVCAQLGEPLLQRQRALAGVVPWIPLGAWHGNAVRWIRAHPAGSTVTVGSVVALAAVAVVAATAGHPAARERTGVPRPSPSVGASASEAVPTSSADTSLTARGGPVLPAADELVALAGQRVTARGVRVLSVPADEGFWVGDSPRARVWVQLSASGESPVQIRPGQRLSFVAEVVRHDAGFARRVGATDPDDERTLTRQGAHLVVDARAVMVDARP